MKFDPMNPAPPVTRMRIVQTRSGFQVGATRRVAPTPETPNSERPIWTLELGTGHRAPGTLSYQPDLAAIAQHEAVRLRFAVRAEHLDALADQAILQPAAYIGDPAVVEDDTVLDLAILHQGVVIDRGEWSDVGIDDLAALADDHWPSNGAGHNPRPLLHTHLADELRGLIHLALHPRGNGLEHDPVGLQHVFKLPGILPPTADHMWMDTIPLVDEILDGIRNLQLAPRRRLDGMDRLEDRLVKHIDAHEREVAFRVGGLLLQGDHPPIPKLRHPKPLRVTDLGKQDLRVGLELLELFHQRTDPVLDKIITQIHDEWLISEKRSGDLDRVGQTEGSFLLDIGNVEAPPRAIAHGLTDLLLRLTHHDPNLPDLGFCDRLQRIEKDRFIGDGHELFGAGVGDGTQAGPPTTAQDQGLHRGASAERVPSSASRRSIEAAISDGSRVSNP